MMDKIFKSLADLNRRKILTILKNGTLSVNEILKSLTIKQSTLSNHLSILRKAGLVTVEVKGKNRLYRLNEVGLKTFVEQLNRFISDEMIVRRISQ